MWIKKTKVKTKTNNFTYVQLMKTEYADGRSRQKLILNLGHEEDVDMDKALRLAKSISNDHTYDFVDADVISLLPAKLYGEIHLLMKLFEITSMQRFIQDTAHTRGVSADSVRSVFLLICYYFLNYESGRKLKDWMGDYYFPDATVMDPVHITEAFDILHSFHRMHPGIETLYRNALAAGEPLFALCCNSRYRIGEKSEDYNTVFTVNRDQIPLEYKLREEKDLPEYSNDISAVVFAENPSNLRSFINGVSRWILKVDKADFRLLPCNAGEARAFCDSAGHFSDFRGFGFKHAEFDGVRIIVLANEHGDLPAVDEPGAASRDILVTNTDVTTEYILSLYFLFQEMQDICAETVLPGDLNYLHRSFSAQEILSSLTHIQAIQIFLLSYLESKLSRSMQFADVLQVLRDIKVARLKINNTIKLVHSRHSVQQEELLNTIAFH